MKTFAQAFAIVLTTLPLMAGAAGTKISSNAMQVTFTVTESCSVQSADTGKSNTNTANAQRSAAPLVSCQLHTPYQVHSTVEKTAGTPPDKASSAAIRLQSTPQDWTIYF